MTVPPPTKWEQLLLAVIVSGMVLIMGLGLTVDARAAQWPPPYSELRAATGPVSPPAGTRAKRGWVICQVFGSRCQEALRVSWCESSWRPWARDYASGTHWGLFQVSAKWRKDIPGFPVRNGKPANNTWAQARHGKKVLYHPWVGGRWNPTWSCRP